MVSEEEKEQLILYMRFVLRHLMEKHWEYDTPMYLAFLDIEKAFDRVPCKKNMERNGRVRNTNRTEESDYQYVRNMSE